MVPKIATGVLVPIGRVIQLNPITQPELHWKPMPQGGYVTEDPNASYVRGQCSHDDVQLPLAWWVGEDMQRYARVLVERRRYIAAGVVQILGLL